MNSRTEGNDAPILPGDVVQVTDPQHKAHGLIGMVVEKRSWGCSVDFAVPTQPGSVVPLRLKEQQFSRIGVAVIVPGLVAKARGDMMTALGLWPERRSGVVMQLAGKADGSSTPLDGWYLEDFDFEAFDGSGNLSATRDVTKAKVFPGFAEAMAFRNKSPECRPFREDGLPNRPLTATNWAFVQEDQL